MKVPISLTVEVDPVTWALIYGTGADARVIREDVKSYVRQLVHQTLREHQTGQVYAGPTTPAQGGRPSN